MLLLCNVLVLLRLGRLIRNCVCLMIVLVLVSRWMVVWVVLLVVIRLLISRIWVLGV